MSMAPGNGPMNRLLLCEVCHFIEFSSYSEYCRHHLKHIRQPFVNLTRLSDSLVAKLKEGNSYRISSGVARKSIQVPPIKLSVVKQSDGEQFLVIKKKEKYWSNKRRSSPKHSFSRWAVVSRRAMEREEDSHPDMRLVYRDSDSRNGTTATRGNTKSKEKSPQTLKKDLVHGRVEGDTSEEVHHGEPGDVEGLSVSIRSQDSTPECSRSLPAAESRPASSGVIISNNTESIDLRKSKDQNSECRIRVVDSSKLLKKLLSGTDVSAEIKPQSLNCPDNSVSEPYIKLEKIDSEEIEPRTSGLTEVPKIEGNHGNPNYSKNSNNPINQVVEEPAKAKMANGNASSSGQSKQSRNKYSNRGRRKQPCSQEVNGKEPETKSKETEMKVESPAKITGRRKSSAASKTSADQVPKREETHTAATEPSPRPSTSSGIPGHMDLSVYSSSQPNHLAYNWESLGGTVIRTWNIPTTPGLLTPKPCVQLAPQPATNNANSGKDSAGITSTLITTDLKNHDANVSAFANVPVRSENFSESNFVAEAEEVRENFCDSVTSDGHDSRRGPHQPDEQAAFWSSLQRANNQSANNHQEAVIGHNNHVPNNEAINVNLLRSFLAEHQAQHGPIPTDNAEFVSLERLAAQHQQPRYSLNTVEVTTPMEQLTQQVHRMSNPPPQINIIAQHHMQAPPPLHPAGVPLHQHSAPYDALSRMQPPMGPPPLFQGFTMFSNQAFQQPGSTQQMIPRPPALQQCPQIQAGAFQTLATPQQPRQKVRPSKRSMPAPPPAPEMLVSKQHRSEPAVKGKSQLSKDKGKGKASPKPSPKPSVKATPKVTPKVAPKAAPKAAASTNKARAPTKKMDPQMVARVLAARGITVTPSTSRGGNGTQKPQQKNTSTKPVINISSAISITPSAQNKNASTKLGNTAADLKHSGPIINNEVSRPERCATVDLTDDEDPRADVNAAGPSVNRFVCSHCGQKAPTAAALELHLETHRASEPVTFRCNPCNLEFSTAEDLERHRMDTHKYRGRAPNWVIPVVDLDFPGAEDRLAEYGINNFIPLSLDDDDGNYAIPIIRQDTPRRHRDLLGVSNVIVMGQIRSLFGRRNEAE